MKAVEPLAERRRYYNPKLDPHCQAKMTPAMLKAVEDGTYDDGSEEQGGPLNTPDGQHPANLVSSLCEDGLHRPAIDIDIPCELVSSSTPGHFHLYFPTVALSWDDYQSLLVALVAAGIVDDRYVVHSMRRGQTLLRAPGVTKSWVAK